MATGNASLSALTVVSESFTKWLEDDVINNIVGAAMIVLVLVGIVLNILVIRVIALKSHTTISGKVIFVQLIVIDILAYIVIILPGIVAAFWKDLDVFSGGFCMINGLCVTLCWLSSAMVMAILCCERTMKLWKPTTHESVFGRMSYCVLIVTVMWIFCSIMSVLPLISWDGIEYPSLQQRCNLARYNRVCVHLLPVFGLYVPLTVVGICGIFTFIRKRQIVLSLSKLNAQVEKINLKLAKSGAQDSDDGHSCVQKDLSVNEVISGTTDVIVHGQDNESAPFHGHVPLYVAEAKIESKMTASGAENGTKNNEQSEPVTSRSENNMKIEILSNSTTLKKTRLSKVKVMFNVYKSSAEERDVTLAASYTLMSLVVSGLWLPYVALCYVDGGQDNVWGGWFALVVLLSDISYCIKPVVYLSHNRVLQKATVSSFPESLRNRAARANDALKKIGKKIDSFVYIHIPDTKSLIDVRNDRIRVSPTN